MLKMFSSSRDITYVDDEMIDEVLNSIGTGVPLKYGPSAMWHGSASTDPWDRWETEKYHEQMAHDSVWWCKLCNFVHVHYEIMNWSERQQNSFYCNKSKYNRKRGWRYRKEFTYVGTRYASDSEKN
jgi:hypothetical protein